MKLLQKGFRKVFVCMVAFIWAMLLFLLVIFLVWWLFPESPDIIVPILAALLTFGSTVVLYLFASNYGEHREESKNGNSNVIIRGVDGGNQDE